jgi:DNA invertase Pin-like site-specific DNA recombinase
MASPTLPLDLYLRVSARHGREGERYQSPTEQEAICRAYAKQHELEIGETIGLDTHGRASGGTVNRRGLQRALERVRAGESGGIICAWIDRLSRDVEQGHQLLREFEEAGGRVYSPDMPEDASTPEGGLQIGMFLLFAQYERKKKSAGLRRAQENAISRGVPIANSVGYTRGDDGRFVVIEETKDAIRKAFEMRAAGAGPTEIGRTLDAAGVMTTRGATTWSIDAVKALLVSRAVVGEARYGDFVKPGAHEAIVDEALWQAAQRPGTRPAGAVTRSYLLAGIVRCSACGYALHGTSTGGKRNGQIYRCRRRHAAGECPSPARVRVEMLDAFVQDAFFTVTAGTIEEEAEIPVTDLSKLQAALDRAQTRLDQALLPETQDALGIEFAAFAKARRQERDDAAAMLGRARAAAPADKPDVRSLQEAWPTLSVEVRREILAETFPAIAVQRQPDEDGNLVVRMYRTMPDGLRGRGNWSQQSGKPAFHPL